MPRTQKKKTPLFNPRSSEPRDLAETFFTANTPYNNYNNNKWCIRLLGIEWSRCAAFPPQQYGNATACGLRRRRRARIYNGLIASVKWNGRIIWCLIFIGFDGKVFSPSPNWIRKRVADDFWRGRQKKIARDRRRHGPGNLISYIKYIKYLYIYIIHTIMAAVGGKINPRVYRRKQILFLSLFFFLAPNILFTSGFSPLCSVLWQWINKVISPFCPVRNNNKQEKKWNSIKPYFK